MRTLEGQVALVTGASSGIGRAIAIALARRGAAVCAVGRSAEKLAETVRGVEAGVPPRSFPTDLTDDAQLLALGAAVERELGRLDALVHSAGIIHHGSIGEAPIAELDAQYRSNVRGPLLLTRTLLPLLEKRGGQIVFVNSTVGLRARAGVGHFAATQHALKAIADALAEEVEPRGVRVASVFPGRTATPRQARIFEHEGRAYRPELLMQPEDVAAMVVAALELPRTASLAEIQMRPMLKSY